MSDTDSMFYVILNIIFWSLTSFSKIVNLRGGKDGVVVVFLFFFNFWFFFYFPAPNNENAL